MAKYALLLLAAVIVMAGGCKDEPTPCSCSERVVEFWDTLHIFGADTIYYGDVLILEAPAGNWESFWWEPSYHFTCPDCASVQVPSESDTYYVTATDSNGFTISDTFNVVVVNQSFFAMPNAFSPNADAQNDFLQAYARNVTSFSFKVKDGSNVVFQTNDTWINWDGSVNGSRAECRNYDYEADVTFQSGTSKHFDGVVTLTQTQIQCPDNLHNCIFPYQFDYQSGGFDANYPSGESFYCP